MKRLWDISPPVGSGSPVFPGDTPYQQSWTAELGPGCPVNVSRLTLSPHVGAHADAPLHYAADGQAVGRLDLDPYLGPCRVVYCLGRGPLIRPEDLAPHAAGMPPRVLVRTFERAPVDRWVDEFAAYAPETLEWLADRGVFLWASTRRRSTRRRARRWTLTRCCGDATCACWKTWCSTTCRRATTN